MEVECDAGYDLVGALPRCVAGRIWTGADPACQGECCVRVYGGVGSSFG